MIAAGGIGIIAAVLGIFLFIGKETYPLFLPAEAAEVGRFALTGERPVLAVGQDPYREVGFAIHASGVDFLRLADGTPLGSDGVGIREGAGIESAYVSPSGGHLVLGLADGRIVTGQISFDLSYTDGDRTVHPRLDLDGDTQLSLPGEGLAELAYQHDGERRSVIVARTGAGRLLVIGRERMRSLLGPGRLVEEIWDTVAADDSAVPVPDSHLRELDRRVSRYRSGPGKLLTLEDLQQRLGR